MKINKNDTIFRDSHNERDKFEELYNTCYEVIEVMIKDNYKFKIHVSKWIDFVIEDVISSDDEPRLNTLKEILKGNHLVISNFIRDKLIEHLSEKARSIKAPTTKYLQIFRSFCIVDKSPVTKNQTNIMNLFVKPVETTDLAFHLKVDKDKLFIEASLNGNYKWRIFGEYYKSAIEEAPGTWKYLVEYINLLADLCYGRNKTVKNYLEKQFEPSVLIDLLKDPSINDAYVPVLRLIHYLYVEGSDYYPVLRINTIQKYDLITDEPTINATEAINKPWTTSMNKLLTELVSKIKTDKKIRPENPAENTKLYAILNAILTTIELGFWPRIEQLEEILKYSLNILANDAESIKQSTGLMGTEKETNPLALTEAYDRVKENLQKPSHENLLVIDCKLMATRIIQAILDFELDIRIKLICHKFKELLGKEKAPEHPHGLPDLKRALEETSPSQEDTSIEPWIEDLQKLPNLKELFDRKMLELEREWDKQKRKEDADKAIEAPEDPKEKELAKVEPESTVPKTSINSILL